VSLSQSEPFSSRADRAFDPIGLVLQFHLTFEFCGQILLDQLSAKPCMAGRRYGGPVPLAPTQAKLPALWVGRQGPDDFDMPLIVRQRTIFDRVSAEFIQGQSGASAGFAPRLTSGPFVRIRFLPRAA
jgi:hypothetical protein